MVSASPSSPKTDLYLHITILTKGKLTSSYHRRKVLKACCPKGFCNSSSEEFHSIYIKKNMLMITQETICDSRSSSFSLCRLGLGSANHLRQNEGLFEDTAAAKQVSVHSCLSLLISSYHFPSEQVLSCPAPVENILVLG